MIEKFSGLRNVQRPERLPPGCLSEVVNVWLDDTGGLETIPGFAAMQAPSGTYKDAWEMEHLRHAFFVVDDKVVSLDGAGGYRTVSPALADSEWHWASVADNLWYAGATDAGWIVNGFDWMPLRLPLPSNPEVSVISGSLPAGQYQVAQVFEHEASGLQSPSNPPVAVEAPAGSALLINTAPPAGYRSHVYVSPCNGAMERFFNVSYRGESLIYDGQVLGRPLDIRQVNTYPLPGDELCGLAWWDERLFAAVYDAMADVSAVYASQRQAVTCFALESDAAQVSGRIYQLLGVEDGVLAATDRSVVLLSDSGDGRLRTDKKAQYGCIPNRPLAKDQWGHFSVATLRGAAIYVPGQGLISGHDKYAWTPGQWCSNAIVNIRGVSLSIVLTDVSGTAYNPYQS